MCNFPEGDTMDIQNSSNELETLTKEILHFKKIELNATLEIGKRLQYVKENDLVHGEWMRWIADLKISHQTAQKYIQAHEQFGNLAMSRSISVGKIFEMVSLPDSVDREEFISTRHSVPSTGEQKTVEEMTVRELREVKKKLKNSVVDKPVDSIIEAPLHNETLRVNEHSTSETESFPDWIMDLATTFNQTIPSILRVYKEEGISLDRLHRIVQYTPEQQEIIAQLMPRITFMYFDMVLDTAIYLMLEGIKVDVLIQSTIVINHILSKHIFSDVVDEKTLKEFIAYAPSIEHLSDVDSFFLNKHDQLHPKRNRTSSFYGSSNSTTKMSVDNSFKLLGVNNNDKEKAKKQYQNLVKVFHPDRARLLGLDGTDFLFQIIKEAYEQTKKLK
jgi:hypothetical protein